MTPEEYAAKQSLISSATARYTLTFAKFMQRPQLSHRDWSSLLSLLYPEVERRRAEAASLARDFYDAQREEAHPELPRFDQFLESYEYEWFAENMEPVRPRMSLMDSPEDALTNLALRVVREVENAGRRQLIHAVQDDSGLVRGWARVATGRETCGWCLMLVSRGPVYYSASSSGLDLDDETAAQMIANGEDISEYMNEWHTGCDCKVVPVFKRQANWVGKAAMERARDLWGEATKIAIQEEKDDPVHRSGKRKGKKFTRNELAINALRRMLASGQIDASEYAALAA
ncbi:hypothetical protein A5630_23105 [Mycolicibacterium mucogenicum]|uniref:Capsid maturation protease n=1 Tax=Mycolicibacterium mucogenicum TaxID=56689 RepID=A0A1A3H145_MYCMU|nr:hypothetical protein [Mycolicibacterium mucogenicum]OBJ41331.1 hypothetical protein A5630_23105 [Mycolicibacterium mucogenicum]